MTLIVAVNRPESIWLLADRRLSSYNGLPLRDDGRKVMLLDTRDGTAILGYAGLGATGRGNEPSDWMAAVLRGRNFSMEKSLGVLAEALRDQFPPHLLSIARRRMISHHVIATAFVDVEPKLYSIDLVILPGRRNYRFRYTRHVRSVGSGLMPPWLAMGGSGALYLKRERDQLNNLLRILRADDRLKLSRLAVADRMAALNARIAAADKFVGRRCMVVWRYRRGGAHNGGGGQQFYTGLERDLSSPMLPSISNGGEMTPYFKVLMPRIVEIFEAQRSGHPIPELVDHEIKATLARLPDKPDQELN